MTRRRADPLRPLSDEEREAPERIRRAQNEPAVRLARAKSRLAVPDGATYGAAAATHQVHRSKPPPLAVVVD